jgi:hypothetical protein
MKLKAFLALSAATAWFVLPAAADAAGTISGTSKGMSWTAASTIVGQTSTATLAGGGNPIYFANPSYNGVVSLIMNEGPSGSFICSGTLLSDRRSILTAGHCVSHGSGTANPISTTAYFTPATNPDSVTYLDPASTAISVSQYFVNPGYTGAVIDQNDIAVLRLSQAAPAWATSYNLYNGGDLTGQNYNIAGYGARSDVGGAIGADLSPGRLRQGDNRYDFRLGDADFGGFFTPGFFGEGPGTQIAYSYLSDFDNGLPQQDASCRLAGAFGLGGAKYCNLGRGPTEVSDAGGDSGGPQFINGEIASVTSYGLTFGKNFGDVDSKLDSSWGEFNGFVPVSLHTRFIQSSMAPEPGTWAMMLGGFGAVGATMRRRRAAISFG